MISGTPSAAGTFTVTATVNDSASHTLERLVHLDDQPERRRLHRRRPEVRQPRLRVGHDVAVVGDPRRDRPDGSSGEPSHAGTWYAWLDGYGTTHTDTITQSVTIPTGCTASLSFYLHIDTAETTTTTQYDKLTVTVNGTDGEDVLQPQPQHRLRPADGSAVRLHRQTVTVKFTGTEDVSLQTSFVLDDTAFNVS